jgi:hypothetical protein
MDGDPCDLDDGQRISANFDWWQLIFYIDHLVSH